MRDSVVILGRGPSAHDLELPADADVMAVSSGIFAMPEDRKPEHFVSLDLPKYFMAPLMGQHAIAWQNDEKARDWPFWADADIVKHVHVLRNRRGFVREVPVDLFDQLPPHLVKWRGRLIESLLESNHEIGFQPGWGDYPNVRGWPVLYEGEDPNFNCPTDPIYLNGVRNSSLMAVQVAMLLGYKQLLFLGVDLLEPGYEVLTETLKRWTRVAADMGVTWVNLSPQSALADWMTTAQFA